MLQIAMMVSSSVKVPAPWATGGIPSGSMIRRLSQPADGSTNPSQIEKMAAAGMILGMKNSGRKKPFARRRPLEKTAASASATSSSSGTVMVK